MLGIEASLTLASGLAESLCCVLEHFIQYAIILISKQKRQFYSTLEKFIQTFDKSSKPIYNISIINHKNNFSQKTCLIETAQLSTPNMQINVSFVQKQYEVNILRR